MYLDGGSRELLNASSKIYFSVKSSCIVDGTVFSYLAGRRRASQWSLSREIDKKGEKSKREKEGKRKTRSNREELCIFVRVISMYARGSGLRYMIHSSRRARLRRKEERVSLCDVFARPQHRRFCIVNFARLSLSSSHPVEPSTLSAITRERRDEASPFRTRYLFSLRDQGLRLSAHLLRIIQVRANEPIPDKGKASPFFLGGHNMELDTAR